MSLLGYVAGAVALVAAGFAVTRLNAIHALLCFMVSLLGVAVVMALLGAPLAAALEVIIYAGAILVLFVFAIMTLNQGPHSVSQERSWLSRALWVGSSLWVGMLLAALLYVLWPSSPSPLREGGTTPVEVGRSLFGEHALAVELASFVMLAGLVGAYHLGRRRGGA